MHVAKRSVCTFHDVFNVHLPEKVSRVLRYLYEVKYSRLILLIIQPKGVGGSERCKTDNFVYSRI